MINAMKSELLKHKKSIIWLIALLMPVISFSMLTADLYVRGSYILSPDKIAVLKEFGIQSQWQALFFENHMGLIWYMLSSIAIVLISVAVNYIEYREGCWKLLLSKPVKRHNVYITKWAVILICSIILIVFNILFTILDGKLFKMQGSINASQLFKYFVAEFFSIMGLASLQQFISCMMENSLAAAAIGFAGVIGSFMIAQNDILIRLVPYCYMLRVMPVMDTADFTGILTDGILSSLFYLALGIFMFSRKDVN